MLYVKRCYRRALSIALVVMLALAFVNPVGSSAGPLMAGEEESESLQAPEAPTIDPWGGDYREAQEVSITGISEGCTAYYTTDASDPCSSQTATGYSSPFTVSESCTVSASVYQDQSGLWSQVTSADFVIEEDDKADLLSLSKIGVSDAVYFEYTLSGSNATITGYTGTDTNVIIPDTITNGGTDYTVTAISNEAFYQNTVITSLSIPGSVQTIEDGEAYFDLAFGGDIYPVTYDSGAFAGCNNLSRVSFESPSRLESIGMVAFLGCSSLTEINLPDNVEIIGGAAFYGCTAIDDLNLPGSAESIGQYAFYGCTGLSEVSLPGSVSTLEKKAFQNCGLSKAYFWGTEPSDFGTDVFAGADTGFTLYYHVSQVAGWADFDNSIDGYDYSTASFCVLTLDLQDGETPESSYVTVDGDGHISFPVEPTRFEYKFGGWYKDSDCSAAFDFIGDTVNDDLTLYALWYQQIEGTATDNSVTMLEDNTTISSDNSWTISISSGTLKGANGTDLSADIQVEGLPDGFSYTAINNGSNGIMFTVSGTADPAVSLAATVTITILSRAVSDTGLNDSEAISVYVYPYESIQVAGEPTGWKIIMMAEDNTRLFESPDYWFIKLTNGLLKVEHSEDVSEDDITISGLPEGLSWRAYNAGLDHDYIGIIITGMASSPVTSQQNISVIVRGSAVDEAGAKDSEAISGFCIVPYWPGTAYNGIVLSNEGGALINQLIDDGATTWYQALQALQPGSSGIISDEFMADLAACSANSAIFSADDMNGYIQYINYQDGFDYYDDCNVGIYDNGATSPDYTYVYDYYGTDDVTTTESSGVFYTCFPDKLNHGGMTWAYFNADGVVTNLTWTRSYISAIAWLPVTTAGKASDSLVTMAADKSSISSGDNTWKIALTAGTLAGSKGDDLTDDITVEGLPEGLAYTAENSGNNNIRITISGTAAAEVSDKIEVTVIIHGYLLTDPEAKDSEPIGVYINPYENKSEIYTLMLSNEGGRLFQAIDKAGYGDYSCFNWLLALKDTLEVTNTNDIDKFLAMLADNPSDSQIFTAKVSDYRSYYTDTDFALAISTDGTLQIFDICDHAAYESEQVESDLGSIDYVHAEATDKPISTWVANDTTYNLMLIAWLSGTESSSSGLSDLSISKGTLSPEFAADVTNYNATVIHRVSKVTVTSVAEDPDSTITVNGETVVSGSPSQEIDLKIGYNTISVVVTAADGKTAQTYTIKVKRKSSQEGDSGSSSITYQESQPTAPVAGGIVLRYTIGSRNYYLNDVLQAMDVAPIILEERTLLPIRYVAQPLGAKVDWDQDEQKVTITLDSKTIEMWIGKNTALVNGVQTTIDLDNPGVVPIIQSPGRTMLPLRFIAEILGCQVDWDDAAKQVTVFKGNGASDDGSNRNGVWEYTSASPQEN